MDERNVSLLCEMLDTIWAELPGQEVVYQWVEWIRNASLSHLWLDGKIMLGQDIPMHKGDMRAISRAVSLDTVIPSMLSYNSKKHYQTFLEDLHMCMICINQSKGKNICFLPSLFSRTISKKSSCYAPHAFCRGIPRKNSIHSIVAVHFVLSLILAMYMVVTNIWKKFSCFMVRIN